MPKAQPADAAIRLASVDGLRAGRLELGNATWDVSHGENAAKMVQKCGETPGILIGNCQKRVCLKTLGDAVKGNEDPMFEKKCVHWNLISHSHSEIKPIWGNCRELTTTS